MPHIFLLKIAVLLGMLSSAFCSADAQIINPRIEGLEIGSKYSTIVKKLGMPLSSRRGGEVPCGGEMRTLSYRGLVLRLEVGGNDPLGLYKVEIASPKWLVSGLRIGARRTEVVKRFWARTLFY